MPETTYRGINWGRGSSANRDAATGIRYGIIHAGDVGQAWHDASEPDYGEPHCPKCGNEVKPARGEYARYTHEPHQCDDYVCHHCRFVFGSESAYPDEPCGIVLDDGEYTANEDDTGDVWVFKSPFYTHAQFCSPCAPGACYLTNWIGNSEPGGTTDEYLESLADNRAYCFGHDWFEDGAAPYPVYSVKTGKRVLPGKEGGQ